MLVAMTSAVGCASGHTTPSRMSETTRSTYTNAEGSRDFVLFRPASLPAKRENRSLVVMLHGCTQTADDIMKGTRMNAAADASGFLVAYPEQTAAAHPQKCWNWYVPQQSTRDHGEAALLAGLIDSLARAEGVSAQHVSLVGISAGAAMAGNLVVAYPERYAALAMHSGIPALAASDVAGALAAMRQGASDGDALGARALAAMGSHAKPIAVIVLHGADDKVVSPANLRATVRQWTVVNSAGRAPVEEHVFPGVGHAWSGGSAEGTYTAPGGPDATGLIVAFLRKVGAIVPRSESRA
jgi:poly(hydroxyalkanoate) depolymerase family esterase